MEYGGGSGGGRSNANWTAGGHNGSGNGLSQPPSLGATGAAGPAQAQNHSLGGAPVDSLAALSAHVGVGVAELLGGTSTDEFEQLFSVFGVQTVGKVRIRAEIAQARSERDGLRQRVLQAEEERDSLRQQLAKVQSEAACYQAEASKNKDLALKFATEAERHKALAEEQQQINRRLQARLLNPSAQIPWAGAGGGAAVGPPAYNPALLEPPQVVQAELLGDGDALALSGAEALAAVRGDTRLQVGQRLNVPGHGFGTYMGFEQKMWGANLHQINFTSSGPQKLELKTPAWAQCQNAGAHWVVQDGVLYGGCVFRVEHAGTPGVNGCYRVQGLHMGERVPQYCKVDNEAVTIKKYAGGARQWSIELDGGKYSNYSESERPPQGGWVVVRHSGAAPAPRLIYV